MNGLEGGFFICIQILTFSVLDLDVEKNQSIDEQPLFRRMKEKTELLTVGVGNPFLNRIAEWDGVTLFEVCVSQWELADFSGRGHLIFLPLERQLFLEQRAIERLTPKSVAPGQISIVPAGMVPGMHYLSSGRVAIVALQEKILICAAAELGRAGASDLVYQYGVDDPLVREFILALRAEGLREEPPGTAYAKTLASALALHLIHKYCAAPHHCDHLSNGLSTIQLRQIIDYINERISDDISLSQLASLANLSLFHFARLFKQSTGYSPLQYVNRCRIDRAKELLMRSDCSIKDIAALTGFCDQSHLSRHFRRALGLTPAKFIRQARNGRKTV